MKTKPCIIALVALAFTGCANIGTKLKQINEAIPDGNWKNASAEVNGKFTSTTLKGTGVKKDGKWVRGHIHFHHTNPWVTNADLDLEAEENE